MPLGTLVLPQDEVTGQLSRRPGSPLGHVGGLTLSLPSQAVEGVGAGAQPRVVLPAPVCGPQRKLQGESPQSRVQPLEASHLSGSPPPPSPSLRAQPGQGQTSVLAPAKCRSNGEEAELNGLFQL